MMKPLKSTLTHPVSGRKIKIDSSVYKPFKAAILQSLKKSKGKTFTELSEDVASIISKKNPVPVTIGIKRSVPWFVISIRLDLETKGLVETFTEKGKKLIRLKK